MQKGQVLIWIIVGALIIVVTGGVYLIRQNNKSRLGDITFNTSLVPPSQTPQPSQSPSPSANPGETANWKTYTNTKYGFSFKYPDYNWQAKEVTNPITGEYLHFTAFCNTNNNECSDNMINFGVTIVPYKSFEEYLSAAVPKITDYEKFQLNSIPAIKAVNPGTCTFSRSTQCELPVYEIFLIHNNQGFLISESFKEVTYADKLNQFPKPNPDILATFKFLK